MCLTWLKLPPLLLGLMDNWCVVMTSWWLLVYSWEPNVSCHFQIRLNSPFTLQVSKGDSKNAKKKNNKKTSKNKSSLSRGNKKKPGMPNVSNDLSQKLYATMEKHKEVRTIFKVSEWLQHLSASEIYPWTVKVGGLLLPCWLRELYDQIIIFFSFATQVRRLVNLIQWSEAFDGMYWNERQAAHIHSLWSIVESSCIHVSICVKKVF